MSKRVLLPLAVITVAAVAAITYFLLAPKKATSPSVQSEVSTPAEPIAEETPEEEPTLPVADLQPVIDAWGAEQTGDYSIVVYDLANQTTVGTHQPDKVYFAASLYKLFVAYEGYLAASNNLYQVDEPYLGDKTRGECLDAMLRSSDSPCGEKFWNELGKQELTAKLQAYNITNTSMTNITTTAQDVATLLIRLHEGRDLPKDLSDQMLDSMKTQDDLYRRGLPSGFSQATVYNKVGWNEYKEWHDGAIITLPSGRSYVIALFTENVGITNVRELANSIESKLLADE